jgi:hypothetical protein
MLLVLITMMMMMMNSGGGGGRFVVVAAADNADDATASSSSSSSSIRGGGRGRDLRFAPAVAGHFTELGVCMDHPNLQYEKDKNGARKSCTWVGKKWKERCELNHTSEDSDHLLLKDLCPVSCKECIPAESSTSSSSSSSSCVDFPNMNYFKNNGNRGNPKECIWVKEQPNQRCKLRFNDNTNNQNNVYSYEIVRLRDYCPLSCGMCGNGNGNGNGNGSIDSDPISLAEDALDGEDIFAPDFETPSPSMAPVMAPEENKRKRNKNKTPKPTCPCNRENHTDSTDMDGASGGVDVDGDGDGGGGGGAHDPTSDAAVLTALFEEYGGYENPCEAEAAALAALALSLSSEQEQEQEEETTLIIEVGTNEAGVDESILSSFEIGAIAAGIALLILLLLLCCTYKYYRKQKQKQKQKSEQEANESDGSGIECPVTHKIIAGSKSEDSSNYSNKGMGRRLVDYVVSIGRTRSGTQYNVTTDVHECTSAYCVVCERKLKAIMSIESYDNDMKNLNQQVEKEAIESQSHQSQSSQSEYVQSQSQHDEYNTGSDTDTSSINSAASVTDDDSSVHVRFTLKPIHEEGTEEVESQSQHDVSEAITVTTIKDLIQKKVCRYL